MLKTDEGMKLKPYHDTNGKRTIGVGRNLDDKGLSNEEVNFLLINDIKDAIRDAQIFFPQLYNLSENRQMVLVNMAFNLGLSRLQGFKKMQLALNKNDFNAAADEMLDSKWSKDVKGRAERLAAMMRNG